VILATGSGRRRDRPGRQGPCLVTGPGAAVGRSPGCRWTTATTTARFWRNVAGALDRARAVRSATGVTDLRIDPVLLLQNFGPGEVDERPQFGIFPLCTTRASGLSGMHRRVRDAAELQPTAWSRRPCRRPDADGADGEARSPRTDRRPSMVTLCLTHCSDLSRYVRGIPSAIVKG
jgi:hypothetical protein